ncbi:winged helix-turn-helix domain-containing protein [Streptomyces anulatus]|nr:winged helix-turn-helix domain-containing protein [Streptomyces anulatus]MCX4489996.1 winged helix-turn-helix domain-containing protein [Streptomyces anulatus]
MDGLRSAGPANSPTITDAQFTPLEVELGKGPATHGFEDEHWTLVRVQMVIRRRLQVRLSVATVWRLLKRHDWSCRSTGTATAGIAPLSTADKDCPRLHAPDATCKHPVGAVRGSSATA